VTRDDEGVTDLAAPTTEAQLVDAAVDRLLETHDPRGMDRKVFRGHQFDAGLAWVHFPVGHGGLGVAASHQGRVEARLRAAGAAPADPTQFFMNLAGPTIVTHGSDELRERYLRPMFTGE